MNTVCVCVCTNALSVKFACVFCAGRSHTSLALRTLRTESSTNARHSARNTLYKARKKKKPAAANPSSDVAGDNDLN